MKPEYESLADIMREDEERRLADARAEIAAEKAVWDALTPEEQAARTVACEAKYTDVPDDDGEEGDDDD